MPPRRSRNRAVKAKTSSSAPAADTASDQKISTETNANAAQDGTAPIGSSGVDKSATGAGKHSYYFIHVAREVF